MKENKNIKSEMEENKVVKKIKIDKFKFRIQIEVNKKNYYT